jgi:hypothetical protein
MTDNIVMFPKKKRFIPHTSTIPDYSLETVVTCGECQNKTFVLIVDDELEDCPIVVCAACNMPHGIMGWVGDGEAE